MSWEENENLDLSFEVHFIHSTVLYKDWCNIQGLFTVALLHNVPLLVSWGWLVQIVGK